MQKITSRSMLIQRKFISRCSTVHQYKMVLFKKKPSTSLVMRVDEDKHNEMCQPNEVKVIRSNPSGTLWSSESNYIVLHTNTAPIKIPVVEEYKEYNNETPTIKFVDILKWLAKTEDSGSKDAVQPGARIGRLDASNEAGFFHRTNRSRLKDIKNKLKDKINKGPTEPKKTG